MIRNQGIQVNRMISVFMLLLVACETGSSPLPSIRLSVSPTENAIFEGQGVQLSALARNAAGALVPASALGIDLSWTSSNPNVASVDGEGHVVGLSEGITSVSVSGGGSTSITSFTVALGPSTLTAVTLPDSVGVVGDNLSQPLRFQVSDNQGRTLAGIPVSLTPTAQAGVVSPATTESDSMGMVSADWTLGTRPGRQRVSVHAGFSSLSEAQSGTGRRPEPVVEIEVRVEAGPTESIRLAPAVVSMASGNEVRVRATPVDRYDNTTDVEVTWNSSTPNVATVSASGDVTGVSPGSATIEVVADGASEHLTVTVVDTPTPDTVSDLSVSSVTSGSATVTFTEVGDGAGSPARYQVRFYPTPISEAWVEAMPTAEGSCAGVLEGSSIGSTFTCSVEGLGSDIEYDFQMVAYRGSLGGTAIFGARSNVVSARTEPGGVPGSLSISPRSPRLTVGAGLTLLANARDPNSLPIAQSNVTWSTSNPGVVTVSNTGRLAAKTVGAAWITVTALCCQSDSVLVNVEEQALSTWPNQPSHLVLQTDNPWTSLTDPGWVFNNWAPAPALRIVPDGSDPVSPGTTLEHFYHEGLRDGTQPGVNGFGLPHNTTEIYAGAYWKADPDWIHHPNQVKLFHLYFPEDGPNAYVSWQGAGFGHPDPNRLAWYLSGWGGYLPSNLSVPAITVGKWTLIEMHAKINDPGTSNGFIRLWVDGVVSSEATGLTFPSASFVEFNISGTWGGGGPSVPEDQWIRIGHLRVLSR